ncbi:MAG: HAMP domain-containing histidine kinase [Oscillospiraceae bacterium]|nr:HAMP domain-containing histidine kinase [Oscillospiraceae bacterium]
MNSITKRWIKGSLLIIIVLLVMASGFLLLTFRNSYYSAAQTALSNRINTINGTLNASGRMSDGEKEELLFRLTSDFAEKDKFELMLLGDNGQVLATSSGFTPESRQNTDDFIDAVSAEEELYINTYKSQMSEKIMSATFIMEDPARDVYAVRITTSLDKIDQEIGVFFAFIVFAAAMIVVFSIMSGTFFIRSIVMPIHSIKDTADKIAQGEFTARIESDSRYDDEIGQLCTSINHMAEELGRNDELKNEFISSVSHELRTPLTAIKGWAETMDGTNDIATMQKGTQVILQETDRLYSMVENLLDFSRLQNSTFSLATEKLDLVAEVYDAVIMYTPQAEKQGIEINFEEPEIFIPVMADKSRIRQVMVNLLDNALKYSENNSVIEVNITQNKDRNTATVEVKDYGKGIHPDDISRVKGKFYKGKGSKRGSGIGLALVSEIVQLHGGRFDIESEYGKFTSMQVTLKTVPAVKGK